VTTTRSLSVSSINDAQQHFRLQDEIDISAHVTRARHHALLDFGFDFNSRIQFNRKHGIKNRGSNALNKL